MKALATDGLHRSLGLFKSRTKPYFSIEQLTSHRTPLKALLCQKPWRVLVVGCIIVSEGVLLGGHGRSSKEITDLHSEFWIHQGFKEHLQTEGTASREPWCGAQPELFMVFKIYHVVKRPVIQWYILLWLFKNVNSTNRCHFNTG